MTRLLPGLILSCLILVGVASGTALAEEFSDTITAEEALRAEDARYVAQIANDVPAIERMFGEDLVYIRSVDGAAANKRALVESMRSGTVKYLAMRRSDVNVRTYGCLAVITGFFELELTVNGQPLAEQIRFHSLWAKRGQGTQFVSWQSTRVPPKK